MGWSQGDRVWCLGCGEQLNSQKDVLFSYCDNDQCLRKGLVTASAYTKKPESREDIVSQNGAIIQLITGATDKKVNAMKKKIEDKEAPKTNPDSDWNKYTSNFEEALDK